MSLTTYGPCPLCGFDGTTRPLGKPVECNGCGKVRPDIAEEKKETTMAKKTKKTKSKSKTNGVASKGDGQLHETIRALLATGGVLHTKVYSRELPTPTTPEEAEALAKELAETVKERKIAEGDRREAMAEFRERIVGIKEHQERLADSVRDHTRLEAVDCIEVLLPTNEIDVRRLDTGESVEVRPASKDDLQQALPGVDEDDDDDEEGEEAPGP